VVGGRVEGRGVGIGVTGAGVAIGAGVTGVDGAASSAQETHAYRGRLDVQLKLNGFDSGHKDHVHTMCPQWV
jgi:hypothetical protein